MAVIEELVLSLSQVQVLTYNDPVLSALLACQPCQRRLHIVVAYFTLAETIIQHITKQH